MDLEKTTERKHTGSRLIRILGICAVYAGLILSSGCFTPFQLPAPSVERKDLIRSVTDSITEAEPLAVLNDLNGVRHVSVTPPARMNAYRDAVIRRFENQGLTVTTQAVRSNRVLEPDPSDPAAMRYKIGTEYTMENIIAVKPGTSPGLPPVLLTGHWDSVPVGPGMNDNGSSIAALIEAARVLKNVKHDHTIVFIAFAFEEDGLLGSTHYADAMTVSPKCVINCDGIAFTSTATNTLPLMDTAMDLPSDGDYIGVFATEFSRTAGLEFCYGVDEFVPGLKYYHASLDPNVNNNPFLTDTFRSDHMPFWEKGIPAVFITDVTPLRKNTTYHTAKDTIPSLDIAFMVKVIKASVAALCLEAGVHQ